jgi:hypothetical protein
VQGSAGSATFWAIYSTALSVSPHSPVSRFAHVPPLSFSYKIKFLIRKVFS